jgi:hypothetical protein
MRIWHIARQAQRTKSTTSRIEHNARPSGSRSCGPGADRTCLCLCGQAYPPKKVFGAHLRCLDIRAGGISETKCLALERRLEPNILSLTGAKHKPRRSFGTLAT